MTNTHKKLIKKDLLLFTCRFLKAIIILSFEHQLKFNILLFVHYYLVSKKLSTVNQLVSFNLVHSTSSVFLRVIRNLSDFFL
jgi:hypothetical protein